MRALTQSVGGGWSRNDAASWALNSALGAISLAVTSAAALSDASRAASDAPRAAARDRALAAALTVVHTAANERSTPGRTGASASTGAETGGGARYEAFLPPSSVPTLTLTLT